MIEGVQREVWSKQLIGFSQSRLETNVDGQLSQLVQEARVVNQVVWVFLGRAERQRQKIGLGRLVGMV